MLEELSDSLVSCETANSHQCRCLMPTRRYKRVIKSETSARRSHRRLHRERARFLRDDSVRNSRDEKTGARRRGHQSHLWKIPLLNTKWSKTRTLSPRHRGDKNRPVRLSSSWKFGDTVFSKMHVSHEKSDRWSWLEPHLLGMACKVCRLVELRDFRAQQNAEREDNLLEHHRWQFLTSDPRAKEYMSFHCQGNHEHVWKKTSERKREYPVAMIRRVVNGFVHDLRPPQLHMFLSEADHLLSVSPAVFVASPAQETEDHVSPAERERVQKLIHRLHVAGGHVSKTSLRLLLQRRGCPVWMQYMVDQLQRDSCLESSDAQNAQPVSLATPPKLWQALKVEKIRIGRLSSERFLCTLYGRRLQTVVVFMLSGRESSAAFEPNGATLISISRVI